MAENRNPNQGGQSQDWNKDNQGAKPGTPAPQAGKPDQKATDMNKSDQAGKDQSMRGNQPANVGTISEQGQKNAAQFGKKDEDEDASGQAHDKANDKANDKAKNTTAGRAGEGGGNQGNTPGR